MFRDLVLYSDVTLSFLKVVILGCQKSITAHAC